MLPTDLPDRNRAPHGGAENTGFSRKSDCGQGNSKVCPLGNHMVLLAVSWWHGVAPAVVMALSHLKPLIRDESGCSTPADLTRHPGGRCGTSEFIVWGCLDTAVGKGPAELLVGPGP